MVSNQYEELAARITRIEERLHALEHSRSSGREPAPSGSEVELNARLGADSVSSAATHLGRILLIFGGAYLLRAITDYGFIPTGAGIFAGALYAVLWLYIAYRNAAEHRVLGILYGSASVLLFLPLLVEAVTHFGLLSGPQSAAALMVFCAIALAVAVRRELRVLAWLAILGTIATSLLLFQASHAALTFTAVLLALAFASLWIVYSRSWRGLQWISAAGALAGLVLLAVVSTHEEWGVSPDAAFYMGMLMWGGYLISFAVRTHVLDREPGIFEAVEAVLASAVVFGIALQVAAVRPAFIAVIGIAGLGIGVLAYLMAFTKRVRVRRGPSFYLYSSLGLALVIGGSALLLAPPTAAVVWSLMAVAAAWVSGRQRRVSLSLHCTVLLVAASAASGALATGLHAFVGALSIWPSISPAQWITAAAAVACLFIPIAQRSERWGVAAGLPQLIVLVLSIWVVGGLMVGVLAPLVAHVPGAAADTGAIATLRTAVLAAAAVVLAFASRFNRWPEARWLAYPVLATIGIKLVFEDFPGGRPLTLFMALALVGVALLLVPRLLPRREPAADDGAVRTSGDTLTH